MSSSTIRESQEGNEMRRIEVKSLASPKGAYSHGVALHGALYTCGMGPIDPQSGLVVGTTIEEQTLVTMNGLKELLSSENLGFGNVVKANVYLADLQRDFTGFNNVYQSFFENSYPVRTTVGAALLNILVEIDMIASYEI